MDSIKTVSLVFCLIAAIKATKNYDVAIVGAGMAGLSAAQHLVNNNVTNIVVLEAKDRIGGRIHTRHMESGPAEMGAQWIHGGTVLNNVYIYANSKGFVGQVTCLDDNGPLVMKGGFLVDKDLVDRIYADIEATESRFEFRNISYEAYLNRQFDSILSSYRPGQRSVVKQVLNSYKLARMFDDGDDLRLSATRLDYFQYPCDIDIVGGNNQITRALKRDIGPGKILLNREVVNINWGDSASQVTVTVKHNDVQRNVTAKYVIATVSLGVLKKTAATLFTPTLPETKREAMARLIFGRGVKIFLYYKKPFWRRLKALKIGKTDEEYRQSRNEWIHTLNEFYELPDNPNVLLTVVFGRPAASVELMDPKQIGREISQLLRNYTGDRSLPEPDEVIKSNWIHDRFIGGTYSCPGVFAAGDEQQILGEPVNRLLFAGEATQPKTFSTMHGARSSGIREANRIITDLLRKH